MPVHWGSNNSLGFSGSPLVKELFPDGGKQISEVNKRPLTGWPLGDALLTEFPYSNHAVQKLHERSDWRARIEAAVLRSLRQAQRKQVECRVRLGACRTPGRFTRVRLWDIRRIMHRFAIWDSLRMSGFVAPDLLIECRTICSSRGIQGIGSCVS